uniref:Sea24 n=1 Tax=Klebsiella pneumoniae TaxID=573 RepID=A0A486V9I3_KLEPN|nr:Sea24 [Klebsiella pneumoniae]
MLVTMSDKELSRINIIQSVVEKRMRRRDAAHQLALTERQTQRLMNRFRESGAAGLANLRRGRPGNHRLPESLKLRVLSLLHDHYSDFGPTLAAEKLRERHNITVSVETLRKWKLQVKKSQFTTTQMVRWRLNMATDHSIIRSSINWNASTRGKSLITNGSVLY